ncbi:hypothetical protein Leryth_018580 [Lithospermum erythrorhizon]|nr:hypothetical protein Leryth_018580 [Lithospermum erythrorhizon]
MSSVIMDANLLNFPETIEKLIFPSKGEEGSDNKERRMMINSSINYPVDVLDTPKEYIFYMDVPGLSKSDLQVTIEDENNLVIKSNGKRKREDDKEEKDCKYIRLERRKSTPPQKILRKFKLPENCNLSAITAKCENGVLTVMVEKLPPPSKPKTVQVSIS